MSMNIRPGVDNSFLDGVWGTDVSYYGAELP